MQKAWPGVYVRQPNENKHSNDFYILLNSSEDSGVCQFNGQNPMEIVDEEALAKRKMLFQSKLTEYVANLDESELSSSRSSASRYGKRDSSSESNISEYSRTGSNMKSSMYQTEAKSETQSYVSGE